MRTYCEDALHNGEMPIPRGMRPRQITVILNPAANRRQVKGFCNAFIMYESLCCFFFDNYHKFINISLNVTVPKWTTSSWTIHLVSDILIYNVQLSHHSAN